MKIGGLQITLLASDHPNRSSISTVGRIFTFQIDMLFSTYLKIMWEHRSILLLESETFYNPDGMQVDTLCMLVSWRVTSPFASAKLP
eukprot:1156657-Pelagomonas_calceolata.AAC.4